MNNLIAYIIMVNGGFVLFYLLYKLLFQRDTFFRFRRYYLLGALLFSLIYPLLPVFDVSGLLPQKQYAEASVAVVEVGDVVAHMVELDEVAGASFNWSALLIAIYSAGSAFFLFKILFQLVRLVRFRLTAEVRSHNGISYRQLVNKHAPFSFFKWIFVDENLHNDAKLDQILIHEYIHANQWHSADVMLAEIVRVAFWWNPAVWLIKKEIVINLEYIADSEVLSEGVDRRDYQYHLLHLTYPQTNLKLTNNFNVSQLKQRITMMNKEKTPVKQMAKYLLVLPMVLLLITANSVYAQKVTPQKVITTTGSEGSVSFKIEKSDDALKDGKIIIRGIQDSINGKPLIIVDDVRMAKDFEINSISTNDIQSISVLKDKSAVALHGEEAKNGVIIITTKKKALEQEELKRKAMTPDNNEVFVVVENQPEYPGGSAAMMEFLAANIQYPAEAKDKGIQGRVITNFVIETDGSISDVQIVRGVDPLLDKEAARVIGSMPKWKPGVQRGNEVRVRYTLPVVFRLPAKQPLLDEIVIKPVPMPIEFPGGSSAMLKYISDNVKYPVIAQENGIQGLVEVTCSVNSDGEVKFVQFNKKADPSLDNEAKRVMESMPNWQLAEGVKGTPSAFLFNQTFVFRLQGENVESFSAGDLPANAVVIVGYGAK